MLEGITPILSRFIKELGQNAVITFGEYDNIVQESLGSSKSLISQTTDAVFIFQRLETSSPTLVKDFIPLSQKEIEIEIERILSEISNCCADIRKQTDGIIIWSGFELPVYPAYGAWDACTADGQLAAIRKLNKKIRDLLETFSATYFLDMDLIMSRVGYCNFIDNRMWQLARAPYTLAGLEATAAECIKFLRPLCGKNRKALVLDCDNTLWGGIIGEDMIAGIKLGKTFPGSSFLDFQHEILSLHQRGIILALCSKNNEHDVWDVFDNHPDMILKRRHIAAAEINWNDKVTNLQKIAEKLNIGLDSLVFMDDSEFEINMVRKMLPEVATIHLPTDFPSGHRDKLASCGLFDTLSISKEDINRGKMYFSQELRQKEKKRYTDIAGYLESLQLEAVIQQADKFSIPRISQQTQKTNQFNLTTKRYNVSEIKTFSDSSNHEVFCASLKDRFGDMGIVASCIIEYKNETAIIDTFLISCRALGRGLETIFLSIVAEQAAKQAVRIQGEYIKTPKNSQVEFFYEKAGFTKTKDISGNIYQMDLKNKIINVPTYYKKIHDHTAKNNHERHRTKTERNNCLDS